MKRDWFSDRGVTFDRERFLSWRADFRLLFVIFAALAVLASAGGAFGPIR